MKKTLIKDYAIEHNISVQAVYNKIKKGVLVSTEIDKKKYIVECEKNKLKEDTKIEDLDAKILNLKNENQTLKSEKIELENELENLKNQKPKIQTKTITKIEKIENKTWMYATVILIIFLSGSLLFNMHLYSKINNIPFLF